MDLTFVLDRGRGVLVSLGPDMTACAETLNDCVGSMPPRGSSERGLSTHWIDLLTFRLENWRGDDGAEVPLLDANATELVRVGDRVSARSLYDTFDEQLLAADDLSALLGKWRAEVIARQGSSRFPSVAFGEES